MTYLRRAVKYFIQATLTVTIVLGLLMMLKIVSSDISVALIYGWKSVWYILAIFAFFSLIYPSFGYQKRKIHVNGDPALAKDGIAEALRSRGYVPAGETDGVLKFRLAAPVNRAFRMWEDTITLTPVLGGWEAEGLSRDLVRVVSSIEQYFRNHGND